MKIKKSMSSFCTFLGIFTIINGCRGGDGVKDDISISAECGEQATSSTIVGYWSSLSPEQIAQLSGNKTIMDYVFPAESSPTESVPEGTPEETATPTETPLAPSVMLVAIRPFSFSVCIRNKDDGSFPREQFTTAGRYTFTGNTLATFKMTSDWGGGAPAGTATFTRDGEEGSTLTFESPLDEAPRTLHRLTPEQAAAFTGTDATGNMCNFFQTSNGSNPTTAAL